MNKSVITSHILTLGALALSACGFTVVRGSGNVVSEVRQVSNFDAVTLSGSGDTIITQGNEEGLKIEAEDNLIPYIRSEVRGRTLNIYIEPADAVSIRPTRPMRFYVSMKQVTALTLSGSGSMASDNLTAKNLDINISGSGETTIKHLKADSLTTDISGSGKCIIKGDAASQKMIVTGAGNCNTSALNSQDVVVNISGSGKANVMAIDTLDVTITGSGHIYYSGRPKISQHISGSGSITAE